MLIGARTPSPWHGHALSGLSWGDVDDDGSGGALVVAVHGITANAAAWTAVAPRLLADPATAVVSAVVAPELRGRGASRDLPGPWGLARHADDVAAEVTALLDAAPGRRAALVGHSMGAFTLAALAARHPELVARLAGVVLVDGGLPLEAPPGTAPAEAAAAALGPALARLRRTFADPAEHRALWGGHPALQGLRADVVDAYAARDLARADGDDDDSGGWRVPVVGDAVAQDMADLYDPAVVAPGLERLAAAGSALLTCPRGLDDGAPLYAPDLVARWRSALPGLAVREVPDTNHYSVLFADAAADTVAAAVLSTLTAR
ncbi:alpha/beta fold hydrolase [Quadrisphaera oryzae]|uniref:alpha/beta fold hydrolase n=1 Tax=Quadrisphaera TaxID=317661 RepID=UPI001646024C|nr:alpha/beta fold hydrolase [Quadrisphaera sp. RL12-1S]